MTAARKSRSGGNGWRVYGSPLLLGLLSVAGLLTALMSEGVGRFSFGDRQSRIGGQFTCHHGVIGFRHRDDGVSPFAIRGAFAAFREWLADVEFVHRAPIVHRTVHA